MAFWLVLIAILYFLFAWGRFMWPNPDDSLERKNQDEFNKIIEASRGHSSRALLHKLLFPPIAIIYFPFYKPGAGLAVAVVLLGIAFAI